MTSIFRRVVCAGLVTAGLALPAAAQEPWKMASAAQPGSVLMTLIEEIIATTNANIDGKAVVERQLKAVLDLAGVGAFTDAVVAYEPVWAIGTGATATPEQAQDVHAFIRRCLAEADAGIAAGVHILYGGSMKRANSRELLAMPDIDGGLLGGASLKVDEFMAVALTAQRLAHAGTS